MARFLAAVALLSSGATAKETMNVSSAGSCFMDIIGIGQAAIPLLPQISDLSSVCKGKTPDDKCLSALVAIVDSLNGLTPKAAAAAGDCGGASPPCISSINDVSQSVDAVSHELQKIKSECAKTSIGCLVELPKAIDDVKKVPDMIKKAATVCAGHTSKDWCDCGTGKKWIDVWDPKHPSDRHRINVGGWAPIKWASPIGEISWICDGMKDNQRANLPVSQAWKMSFTVEKKTMCPPFGKDSGRIEWDSAPSSDSHGDTTPGPVPHTTTKAHKPHAHTTKATTQKPHAHTTTQKPHVHTTKATTHSPHAHTTTEKSHAHTTKATTQKPHAHTTTQKPHVHTTKATTHSPSAHTTTHKLTDAREMLNATSAGHGHCMTDILAVGQAAIPLVPQVTKLSSACKGGPADEKCVSALVGLVDSLDGLANKTAAAAFGDCLGRSEYCVKAVTAVAETVDTISHELQKVQSECAKGSLGCLIDLPKAKDDVTKKIPAAIQQAAINCTKHSNAGTSNEVIVV